MVHLATHPASTRSSIPEMYDSINVGIGSINGELEVRARKKLFDARYNPRSAISSSQITKPHL
jgi:hypothetical protein